MATDIVAPPTPSREELKCARQAAGITQREAAQLVYISPRTYSDYEQGRLRMRAAIWELLQQKLAVAMSDAQLRRLHDDDIRRRSRKKKASKLERIVERYCE